MVLALVIVLNGIGEDFGLDIFPVLLSILLRANYDRLRAITLVDTVYHLIQPVHLLNLFRIDVEQVLLKGPVWRYAHHDHTPTLVLNPLDKYLIQHLRRCLNDGNRRVCGRNKALLVILPVLQQILSERV